MKVTRTISLDLEDLTEIQIKINEGKISNLSQFVQSAIKNELKTIENKI